MKRCIDAVAAIALFAMLSPVLAAAAVAVAISTRGPVIFRQTRVGLGGERFTLYKFRTMHANSDDRGHRAYVEQLILGDAPDDGAGVYKLTADPRVTRVGRVLRRYSIDELPQLWNVVRGEMSLVGPRPATPHEVALYDPRALARLAVRPGLTGLWQVGGRCRLTFDEMIDLDIAYVRDAGLVLDLRTLAATPAAVAAATGAA